jgi:hypothetical protein
VDNKYTHFCVTEKDEIYVLDVSTMATERAFCSVQHLLLEHPEVLEVSMRAVRLMGFAL